MIKKIQNALLAAGLPEVPAESSTPLVDCGLDSLIMVMATIEFEKAFNIQIPARDFGPQWFENLETLAEFLRRQGVE